MSFSKIVGQELPIAILKNNIASGRLGGAYLFSGLSGVGKMLVARNLAKALNCRQEGGDSCDSCPSCLKIDKNLHPDVHIIDVDHSRNPDTSELKIENILQLQNEVNLKPYEARVKVFIVNDAHRLNPEASNAFLKTLEQPPANTLIILISSKPNLLFKTIVSRCQVLRFFALTRERLKAWLKNQYATNEEDSHFLAYFSEGSIGEALRLKDNGICEEKNRIIDEFVFRPKADLEYLARQGRYAVAKALNIVVSWFRDICLAKVGSPYGELINLDRREELLQATGRYSFIELNQIFSLLSDSLFYLENNINVRLLLSNVRMGIWKN